MSQLLESPLTRSIVHEGPPEGTTIRPDTRPDDRRARSVYGASRTRTSRRYSNTHARRGSASAMLPPPPSRSTRSRSAISKQHGRRSEARVNPRSTTRLRFGVQVGEPVAFAERVFPSR